MYCLASYRTRYLVFVLPFRVSLLFRQLVDRAALSGQRSSRPDPCAIITSVTIDLAFHIRRTTGYYTHSLITLESDLENTLEVLRH